MPVFPESANVLGSIETQPFHGIPGSKGCGSFSFFSPFFFFNMIRSSSA